MPRPRGGDWLSAELRSLREQGVDIVLSLLRSEEEVELDIVEEKSLCAENELVFRSFPIIDRAVPESRSTVLELANSLLQELQSGKNVAIHCRAGIGRASLIAACVLKLHGVDVDEAFEMISRARGFAVPDTPEQHRWVKTLE
ncbi:MAG TPA: dual specificity protein phosphatase family protein [Pyrinomonadaceae bacterium]|nr:dual specificity protein phosphatase family protein [Pyrinomonadaceae bacterium]